MVGGHLYNVVKTDSEDGGSFGGSRSSPLSATRTEEIMVESILIRR